MAEAPERLAHPLHIRKMRFARGTALYRSGDRLESLYMIRSGCITEVDASSGRGNSIIGFVLPGEMLGLDNLAESRSTTTCVAVETSNACALPRSVFDVLPHAPNVAGEFIRFIAKSGILARELVTLIRDHGAIERVAGFLLNLSGRLQFRGAHDREFKLNMNRDDIAAYLGLRSETVSRCFTELDRQGLIRIRAKRVEILRYAALRRMLDREGTPAVAPHSKC